VLFPHISTLSLSSSALRLCLAPSVLNFPCFYHCPIDLCCSIWPSHRCISHPTVFLDPIRSVPFPHFSNCSLPELCRSMHRPNSLSRPAHSSLLAGFGKVHRSNCYLGHSSLTYPLPPGSLLALTPQRQMTTTQSEPKPSALARLPVNLNCDENLFS
jgi:hypothetical protein